MFKRRLKPIVTYPILLISVLVFLYGLLAHGSPVGTTCEVIGTLLMSVSIVLPNLEFKCGEEDMELINLYKIWCKEKGLRPTEATNLKRFLNLIQK